MRCSRPAVPGRAQGRTRFGSRKYGRNDPPFVLLFVVGCLISIFVRSFNCGIIQGSEPLAMYPSESSMTGVMYLTAIWNASIVALKQSAGDDGASTATGHSLLRPYIA